MTTVDFSDLAADTRTLIRDHPQFYEITYGSPLEYTLRLPHPLIKDADVIDLSNDTELATSAYSVDTRNGLLKVNSRTSYTSGLYVSGYHYEWFLDDDLEFYVSYVFQDHLYERPNIQLSDMTDLEKNVISIGGVFLAFVSLLSQFSTEIDVSTPEGMMIPAHQRFTQVSQQLVTWGTRYNEAVSALNVGSNRISMRTLRRISRLTNRYVPLFEQKEVDDPRPPLRSFPPITPHSPEQRQGEDAMLGDYGITGPGWVTIGSQGG